MKVYLLLSLVGFSLSVGECALKEKIEEIFTTQLKALNATI